MYVPHAVTFGDKNTYADWHIVPETRPVIAPPQPKYIYDDLPGADGSLDLTDALTGLINFNDRSGTLNFIVLNDYGPWHERYSEIMQYLHGRKMKMILADDPNYYYWGRYSVNNWTSDQHWSKIDIDYRVDPFKYSVIEEKRTFTISNSSSVILRDVEQLTQLVIKPNFSTTATFNGHVHILFANQEYKKLAVYPDENGLVQIDFTGSGSVTITYRRTRL